MEQALRMIFDLGGGWLWLILGLLLFILEMLAPGSFLVWFGIAAVAVGLLTFAVDTGWQWQLIAFGLTSLVSLVIGRQFFGSASAEADRPFLNRRAQQLTGRTFILEQAIVSGRGRVRIGDTVWTVQGPDLPAGAQVLVTGADGTRLIVEAAAAPQCAPDPQPDPPPQRKPKLPKAGSFH